MEIFRMAASSVRRKKKQSFLALLGVAVGVASVVVIGCIGTSGASAVNAELDSLGIAGLSVSSSDMNAAQLDNNDYEALKNLDCVEKASPIITFAGKAFSDTDSDAVLLWGVSDGSDSMISTELLSGRDFDAYDLSSARNVCMIDTKTAEQYFHREKVSSGMIRITAQGKQDEYEIIGTVEADSSLFNSFSTYIPSFIYIPYTSVQKLVGNQNLDRITITVKSGCSVNLAGNQITHLLNLRKGTHDAIKTENLASQRDKLSGILDIVTVILSAIAGVSLIVAGIGITTVMLFSAYERTREIGIKKSIGATKWNIMSEFLTEAFLIAAAGSIVGAAAGAGLAYLAAYIFRVPFQFSLITLITAVSFSIIIGLLFGVYPAQVAANMRPVEALNKE